MTGPRAGSLVLLYSTVLLMSLGQGMVFPTIPLLASSFAVSAGLAVQVVTAHALGRTIILIPAGLLLDRSGAKVTMLVGSALVLCGAFVTAVTPYFLLLFVGQFLAGVGDSVWTMGREVSGVEMVPQHQRGRLLSGFMGSSPPAWPSARWWAGSSPSGWVSGWCLRSTRRLPWPCS